SPSSSIFLLMPDFSISIFISCIPPQAVTFLSLYSCANIINQNKSICLKNLYCKIWVKSFTFIAEKPIILQFSRKKSLLKRLEFLFKIFFVLFEKLLGYLKNTMYAAKIVFNLLVCI